MEEKKKTSDETAERSFTDDYTTSVVPKSKRKSLVSIVAVWFGFVVSISAFLTGGTLGGGMTASTGLLAVLLGNAVLFVIASLIGVAGQRTGLTTYSMCRLIFGRRGSIISSVILGFLGMFLIGVLMNSFGNSIQALIPSCPRIAAVLLFAAAITSTSIFGMKGLSVISFIAMPSLWILLALSLHGAVGVAGGFSNVFSATPAGSITLAAGVSSVISTWANGACLSADISRYARKPSHVVIGAGVGFLLGTALFEGVAVLSAIGTGNSDFTNMLATIGLLIPGILITLLALWTTTDNNVYSSSLAFTNMGDLIGFKLPKWAWTIICVLIAVIASTLGFASNFSAWLGYLGAATTPVAGILIAFFWVRNRNNTKILAPAGFRISAFIAWAVSFVIVRIVVHNQAAIPVPSSMVGIICGFVLYLALSSFMDKSPAPEDTYFVIGTEAE